MNVITTIIPIFALITLGWVARKKRFMPPEFVGPANRLVYFLAIPAMIFRSISKTNFHAHFNPQVLAGTLLAILAVFVLAWGACLIFRINHVHRGTFIQSSFHGNLGYIALAVAYYLLGTEGLVRASIIAAFVMLLQNFLAVVALQINSNGGNIGSENVSRIVLAMLGNPVIASAMAGILFSVTGIPLPLIIDRCLDIFGSLALPLALLIIGASLSFGLMKLRMSSILWACGLKLIVLPGVGLVLYRLFVLSPGDFLPGLILLASPIATVTFVMAREMKGDADFAVAAISVSTILSAFTFSAWLTVFG